MTQPKSKRPLCGAKRHKLEATCTRPAGWGTDHPGVGRCKLHGGAVPVKHGRYSSITRPRIAELMAEFASDPDPLDLQPEILLLRALVTDFVERYDIFIESMHAWHASYSDRYRAAFNRYRERTLELALSGASADDLPNPPDPLDYVDKPRAALDITAAAVLVDKVGKMVERIEGFKARGHVTLETLNRVMEQLGVEVVHALAGTITDSAMRARALAEIERRWGTIHVDTVESSAARHDAARAVN